MASHGTVGGSVVDARLDVPAPLRTLDWRFLLPEPPDRRFRRLALLGGPPGIVARARLEDVAADVFDTLPGAGGADVVVAYAPASYSLGSIAAAVAPDGCLYLEVDRVRRGARLSTPGRVERLLSEAGLTICAMYAAEPDLAGARAFIPLDVPAAMSWHRTASFGNTFATQVAGAIRRSVVRLAGRTAAALDRPYVVVATRRATGPTTPGALAHPDVARLLGAAGIPAAAVMLTYGGDRIILFPFADGATPFAVVKVPKTAGLAGRTVSEQSRMRELRATLPPSITAAIPSPIGAVGTGTVIIACETFASGTTLSSRASDATRPLRERVEDVQVALAWLGDFHRATETCRDPVQTLRATLVDDIARRYVACFGETDDEARLVQQTRHLAEAVANVPMPVGMQHRDYAAWNVLRAGDRVSVLDWEGARPGPCAVDALHLVTTWLHALRLGQRIDDEVQCVLELFVEPGADAAATGALAALEHYLKVFGVDRRLIPLLLVHHHLELATRRYEQRALQHESESHGDAELAEVRIVRALAQAGDALFARWGNGA